MSNGNVFARLWKLQASANKLVLDGKRNPDTLCALLQSFIEQKQEHTWKTWKTIKLGTGLQTADDFTKAIRSTGANTCHSAYDALKGQDFTVKHRMVTVELILAPVHKLGFENGGDWTDILACAQERGLDLCPVEVAPQLCIQYPRQPKGLSLIIATESITGASGKHHMLEVVNSTTGRFLTTVTGGYSFDKWESIVFLRRK